MVTVRVEVDVVVEGAVELEVLLVVVEEDGVVELAVLLLVLLDLLEDERTTKPPMAIITIMTTAPITRGVETPRLVRMLFVGARILYNGSVRFILTVIPRHPGPQACPSARSKEQ